jgi:cell fate (sporulation/competence/biofilm development) regulator YmcA (YheA/YmcA/DUF963 family)
MIEIRAKPLVQSFRLEDEDDGQVLQYVGSTKHCHHLTTETESLPAALPKSQAAVA